MLMIGAKVYTDYHLSLYDNAVFSLSNKKEKV